MKRKKPPAPRKTKGSILAEKARAQCNELSDEQRQSLDEEFLRLFHARDSSFSRRR